MKPIPIEHPEINPYMYGWLTYNKGAKRIQWGRTVSLINGAGKTGQLHTKEWNRTTVLYSTQKLTQNGLNWM